MCFYYFFITETSILHSIPKGCKTSVISFNLAKPFDNLLSLIGHHTPECSLLFIM